MAFTIPDQGEGDNDIQSILFQEHLDILVDGINGKNCVLSGLAVTGGSDMTPAVAKGAVLSNGIMYAVAAADVTIGTADATNPRIDLIVVNSSGSLAVRAGTAAAAPKPPARTTNDVVIAAVYVPANDTTIGSSQITDMRMLREQGPICIFKQTTAHAVNTSSSAISIFATAPTIPDGLFLAGRVLRVRAFGNFLVNSGTPTLRLIVSYGGTTMFSDISSTLIADADRRPWMLDYNIVAQANNDQALIGTFSKVDPDVATTAPTTGIGDAWPEATTNEGEAVIGGSAAVDSDAGNRTLDTSFTFDVSNANNELVVEGITIELL